jgi:hypothetical protein
LIVLLGYDIVENKIVIKNLNKNNIKYLYLLLEEFTLNEISEIGNSILNTIRYSKKDLIQQIKMILSSNYIKNREGFNYFEKNIEKNVESSLKLLEFKKIKIMIETLEIYGMKCINDDLKKKKFLFDG